MSSPTGVAIEPGSAETARRRRRSILERRRIVEETFVAGASVARVARAHGVNANQVFNWRRLYQRGLLGGNSSSTSLLPVTVWDPQPGMQMASETEAALPAPSSVAPATIQLQLPKGRLRIEGAVDAASLRVVLECLLR